LIGSTTAIAEQKPEKGIEDLGGHVPENQQVSVHT
jgi:hypothetical protein